MELFSEIYSCYYNVVSKILNRSFNSPVTKEDMNEIIYENAFSESVLYIMPKLISGEWNLLENTEDKYISKLKTPVKLPLTTLEKSWLKSILSDKKMTLFFNEEQILYLNKYLSDVDPLFHIDDFYYFDSFSDGDNYDNEDYINNFRKILASLKAKTPIKISFISGKGNSITGNYIPCKLEYSSKDDKFRAYVVKVKEDRIRTAMLINIGRITSVDVSKEIFTGDIDFHKYIDQNQCSEPVIIEISKERNAVERCMLHFASYEKRTEYDKKTDKYISYIYYNQQDETELLVRILSFGPVIRVLGPQNFLLQIKERIKRQKNLLKIPTS